MIELHLIKHVIGTLNSRLLKWGSVHCWIQCCWRAGTMFLALDWDRFVFAHVYIVLFSFHLVVGALFLLNLSHKQEEVALDSSSPRLGEQASAHFVLVCCDLISAFCLFVLILLLSSTPMYEFSSLCTSLMNIYFV